MSPTPYYDDGQVQLYLGQLEDVLPHVSGVQLTVTSPPYNQLHGANMRGGQRGAGRTPWGEKLAAQGYDDDMPEADYQAGQVAMAGLVAAASSSTAALFYNHKIRYRQRVPLHPLHLVGRFDGWQLRQEVVWPRGGSAAVGGGMFVPADERIYWMVRDLAAFKCNRRATRYTTVWDMAPPTVGRDAHPCPFPSTIPERAILATTDRGDLVLDPYSGSGTTLRVAKHLGRRAIGVERVEVFAEAAATMLAAM